MDQLKQPFYLAIGLLLTGIGIAAAFLPLLPSTIFFIFAVYFFARSSPRLEAWILNHQVFGPPVVAWNDYGAIPRKAKYMALTGMAIGFASFVYFAQPEFGCSLVWRCFSLLARSMSARVLMGRKRPEHHRNCWGG